ncbi:Ovarian tumor [Macleaya cordata]|uniref:Ovarian tumor n=1 Tax=Macleaya cordata TaxID=56857 RepID=A0A200QI30_MACCD|nr:Ovarian tumor [Macleaya cordata]
MTRILVQRGSSGSSSNQNRSSLPGSSSAPAQQFFGPQISPTAKEDDREEEVQEPGALDDLVEFSGSGDEKPATRNVQDVGKSTASYEFVDKEKLGNENVVDSEIVTREISGLRMTERVDSDLNEGSSVGSSQQVTETLCPPPPPPPVPPPKPLAANLNSRRTVPGGSNAVRIGSSRRAVAWPVVSTRTSPSGSHPSSPRSYAEAEGYNSADEQNHCFGSSYDDAEREHQFELDIRRVKGLEVKRMLEDGNCLFRAVADQVYGDTEAYDLTRQMCIDYMERERDHFSQFITEGFTSYCKRKRRDKVYGNNVEIQALSEMYNRPIHIYSYSTEPINTFHGSYNTDTPPIRLSYHHGNHYNSLVDPRRLTIGAGLGFSSLQGANIDRDQIKAAIKAQQDQQIDNALLAEGRFYSDLELTEKEMERMVMEASRAEYADNFKQQLSFRESSTSSAEPSSSGARSSAQSDSKLESGRERAQPDTVLSSSMQMVLSMGFSYLQVIEAYSIFGDDADSMSTKVLNLTVLQRIDPYVEEILITAAHVTFYEFNIDLNQWSRKDVEGSLFVVKRNAQPRFQFIVMNRRNTDNLVEDLLGEFEYEIQVPYLLYRNASQEVNGIWFYNSRECEDVANLFSRILNAYSKVPSKPKAPSNKSEFEELEAVPTMAVMEGPLEPSSTTASVMSDVPDDSSFVNFFSAAMNIGNASNATILGQPQQSPARVPLPSHAPSVIPSPVPTPQKPSLPNSPTPPMPFYDTLESSSSNPAANLVKPSSFFAPSPSSSTLMVPQISSSMPTAPPLHPPVNLQRPYGTPLLQPFPPPAPSPSLTPTPSAAPMPNFGQFITRDKVRDALLRVFQF